MRNEISPHERSWSVLRCPPKYLLNYGQWACVRPLLACSALLDTRTLLGGSQTSAATITPLLLLRLHSKRETFSPLAAAFARGRFWGLGAVKAAVAWAAARE